MTRAIRQTRAAESVSGWGPRSVGTRWRKNSDGLSRTICWSSRARGIPIGLQPSIRSSSMPGTRPIPPSEKRIPKFRRYPGIPLEALSSMPEPYASRVGKRCQRLVYVEIGRFTGSRTALPRSWSRHPERATSLHELRSASVLVERMHSKPLRRRDAERAKSDPILLPRRLLNGCLAASQTRPPDEIDESSRTRAVGAGPRV